MPSYEIPEYIVEIPLFVPAIYDFFDVAAGALPNGEDCLRVQGHISRKYKAYQNAQVVTPNLFRTRYDGPWSMSWWFKGSNIAYGTDPQNQIMFGVHNLTSPGSDVSNMNWMVSATAAGAGGTANRIRYYQRRVNPTTGTGLHDGSVIVAQNKWIFCVVNHPLQTANGGGSGGVVNLITRPEDGSETITSCGSAGAGGSSIGTVNPTDPKFCVGSYSNEGTCNGRDGEWWLGKLSFHNHELTLTERQTLFNAMIP